MVDVLHISVLAVFAVLTVNISFVLCFLYQTAQGIRPSLMMAIIVILIDITYVGVKYVIPTRENIFHPFHGYVSDTDD